MKLTDEDWKQIWSEFDESDVDMDFQEYMAKKHGKRSEEHTSELQSH